MGTFMTISLASLCSALLACSSHTGEKIGVIGSEDVLRGTGTIYLNSSSSAAPIECTATNACECPIIVMDGDPSRHLGPANLGAEFMQEDMRVRFVAQVIGQTACCPPPGMGIPCSGSDLVDLLDVKPL